jgi:cytochrome b subunit of formate dehydrogenase
MTKNNLKRKCMDTFTGEKTAPGVPLLLVILFVLVFFAPSYAEITNEDCLACHGDKDLEAQTERGKTLKLFVPADALIGSVHENLSCVDCHKGYFEEVPHGIKDKPLKLDCAGCHADVYDVFIKGDVHGVSYLKGNPRAAYCNNCHGGHNILPIASPDSRMAKLHQADTCGNCHGQEKLNLEDNITKRNLIIRFKDSVHFRAIKEGKNGASCTDCHHHHNILSSAAPTSTVNRTTIMNVCQKCHPNEVKTYNDGPHGRTLQHGNFDVPNCTTCHGDHDMASLRTRVGDAKQWAATQVCIWCHGNERMMARYGLDTIPVQSYIKDFHGLTQRGTMGASATCSDCHDAHHSLPANHPSSRMHISNRGTACGKCHGIVSANFAMSFSHRKAMETPGTELENIIRTLYIILIVCSVIGMLGYNFIVWLWSVRKKFKAQRDIKHVNRMSRYELTSHWILFITFSLLALTGFALKFPDAFWAKWLFTLGMNETIRAFIHRLSAIVMTVNIIVFGLYMLMRKRGRGIFLQLMPRKRDFTDFISSVKFYLNVKKDDHTPKYAVFNFIEKFEFWALIWGTLIMVVSGVILWFPKAIPVNWPPWVINVARVFHYYEALLATLAIIIWHGFHTIFHPDEYPMNTSWITGYITEAEAKHHFEDEAIEKMKKKD